MKMGQMILSVMHTARNTPTYLVLARKQTMQYRVRAVFEDLEVEYEEEHVPNHPVILSKKVDAENPDEAAVKAKESLVKCADGNRHLKNFKIVSIRSIE